MRFCLILAVLLTGCASTNYSRCENVPNKNFCNLAVHAGKNAGPSNGNPYDAQPRTLTEYQWGVPTGRVLK